MARWIAVLLVVAAVFSVSTAQLADEKRDIAASLDENRQWVWTLPASGEVEITDLLALYASCRDVLILFNQGSIRGTTAYRGTDERKLTGDEIDLFVANCLEEYRLALTKSGEGQYRVSPSAEAVTRGTTVTEAEIDTAPAWQWVILVYRPKTIEENSLRGALQNMVSRQGGAINPVAGGGLLICDRADRVREILKAAKTLDEGLTPETKSYDIAEGIKTDEAIRALRELFSTDQKYRFYAPTFVKGTTDNSIIVRGTKELQAEAEKALAQMK
jgi:hypothetical protein